LGKPRLGGALRVGLTGGASSDTLYPLAEVTIPDLARSPQLFNSLIQFDSNGQLVNTLAEEITPNANATEWTIRLKRGITFHDGKDLTADDVVYTFQTALNPKNPAPTAALLVPVDVKGIKKLDSMTVRVPCKTPYSPLPQMIQNYNLPIIPVGYDKAKPVGTGPFRYQSFTPGSVSVFTRNPDYWETGLPYVDTVTITDYADESSMVNALLGGQEDAIGGISVGSLANVKNGGKTLVFCNAGGITPFTMRTSSPPRDGSNLVRPGQPRGGALPTSRARALRHQRDSEPAGRRLGSERDRGLAHRSGSVGALRPNRPDVALDRGAVRGSGRSANRRQAASRS
jgi:peptide/nickel transport system substrate-binding protein